MGPGHRRNETSPIHTQWLCFVQSCLVPTEYFDHVTLAYPCFKAEIKCFTQFSLAFQADTKSPAEPLWGHSLVWRTTCQRAEDESFSETQSRISPSSTDPLHRSFPSFKDSLGNAWEKHVQQESQEVFLSSCKLAAVERQCGAVQGRTKPSWGDFPGGWVAKTPHQWRGTQVQSLVRELDPVSATKTHCSQIYKCVYVLVTQSCPTLCDPMDCSPPGFCPWNSPGKNTGVHCHSLRQRNFPTQGSNPGLLHRRQFLYRLNYREVLTLSRDRLSNIYIERDCCCCCC